ncbi:MAG: recombinase family protein, partial [Bacilli bacterium]|nr:recombinase family protein [Bacilli bacterium]
MFSSKFSCKNTAEIADFLEMNGVKTLTGNDRWSSTSIRRMLKNEKYCGDILLQK